MEKDKTHRIRLIIGDWSRDGHNESEEYVIESNLSRKQVDNAYKKAVEKLGFDLKIDVARQYEDSQISNEFWEILLKNGFKYDPEEDLDLFEIEGEEGQDEVRVHIEGFLALYLFFVKTGNPKFEYKIMDQDIDSIAIGGYGLFH